MTSSDLMPFGKYGKAKLGENAKTVGWIKTNDPGYVSWLINQEGFSTKNAVMHAFFTKGEEASSTVEERRVASSGETLLAAMPEAFVEFWNRAYGDRLRKQGEMNYIGYLRVAITAWESAVEYCDMRIQKREVQEVKKMSNTAALLQQDLSAEADAPKVGGDGRDEEIGF